MNDDGSGDQGCRASDDGLRRRMYRFIRAARRPVTREQAAASVGVSRKVTFTVLDHDKRPEELALARSDDAGRPGAFPHW